MILCGAKVGEYMSNETKIQNIFANLNNIVEVRYFKTIDSTNNEAKRCYDNLSDIPIIFISDHQTNGKGRLGRSFYSPKDTGLYMSLLMKVNSESNIVSLTTATAVCVVKAIEKLSSLSPVIKWVNDIYINDKKVCGILCEAITNPETSQIDAIVIGIGVNISTSVFPEEIKDIAGALKTDIDKNMLCALIVDNILNTISEKSDFIDDYKKYSMVIGKEITYTENGITKAATAIDINQNGGLVINTEDGTKILSTGEISIRLKGN